ncbi:hypothetical protein Tco_0895485 [Tanacetum coccineum]|uniref:Uncharacterized protein n=1 Tax=Tanacetum coccineum TaxID=301880 RepID=A0ABQ5CHA8_9ASTR
MNKKRRLKEKALKKERKKKRSVSKQGEDKVKPFKGEPSLHLAKEWDELEEELEDIKDIMEYTFAQDEPQVEDTDGDKEGTALHEGIEKENEGTDKVKEGTDRHDEGTDKSKVSTGDGKEGTDEQEKIVKRLNEEARNPKLKRVKRVTKDDKLEEFAKSEEKEQSTKKRKGSRIKMLARKKIRSLPKDDSDEELRLCLTIAPDKDKEADFEILDRIYPIIEWKSMFIGIKPQYNEAKDLEEINTNVVIRSDGQQRFFSTLMKGDLMIMFNPSIKDELWTSQQGWKIVSWKLHRSSGLKLETEEDDTMALELIKFTKKQLAELEDEEPNGNEKDY